MKMIKGKRKEILTKCHGGGERREEVGLPIQVSNFGILGFLFEIFASKFFLSPLH
jgi:hypothetical protein